MHDGREFQVVEVFYEPEELQSLLGDEGWTASLDATRWFIFGEACPADARQPARPERHRTPAETDHRRCILASRMPAIDPDIIRRQVVIGAAALSPDGGRVVYTRRTVVGGPVPDQPVARALQRRPPAAPDPRPLERHRPGLVAGRRRDRICERSQRRRAGGDARGALYVIHPDGGEAERICARRPR